MSKEVSEKTKSASGGSDVTNDVDVLVVGGVALMMCLVAAIYPARRAARLAPAAVLNQDR